MFQEEAMNFRLLGHDKSAGWGGGSRVDVRKGHAYVGAVGGSHYNGPEGFTVHDVTDPRHPFKVAEINAPPGVHMHKLRIVGDDFLCVNSERLHLIDRGPRSRCCCSEQFCATPALCRPNNGNRSAMWKSSCSQEERLKRNGGTNVLNYALFQSVTLYLSVSCAEFSRSDREI